MSENISHMNKVFGHYLIGNYQEDIDFIEALLNQCLESDIVSEIVSLFKDFIMVTKDSTAVTTRIEEALSKEENEHYKLLVNASYNTFGLFSELKAERELEYKDEEQNG